jgi:hypothetical protein
MNRRQRCFFYSVVLSLILTCEIGASASAEVHISGTADDVVVQAKNANMGEVLEGIRSALKLRVELAGSTARQFNGSYAGALRHVLSRLLDGESFIISSAPDGMNIVILSPGGIVPRAVPVVDAKRADDAGQPVRLGAIENEDNNPVQGWDPPVPAGDANKPVRLAAEDQENHPLQGWDPPPPTPSPAEAQRAVDASKPQADEEEHNPLQGWDPPPPTPNPAAAPRADDAGKP